jgi:hypothetical protein
VAIDLPEQLGDAHPRQQGVERPVDRLGRLRRRSGNGRHVQPAALEADSLQPTAAEQTGEPLEPLLELFSAPGQVAVAARNDARPDARFRAGSGARSVRLERAADAGSVRLSA